MLAQLNNEMLSETRRRWPLPLGWTLAEFLSESAQVGELHLHVVGLEAHHPEYGSVTGSAGSVEASPTERAYFELLERISVLAAMKGYCDEFQVVVLDGKPQSTARRDQLFPTSHSPTWRPARSNGIALHTNAATARLRAGQELLERDAVLRSWLGGARPVPHSPAPLIVQGLRGHYSVEAWSFPSPTACRTAGFEGSCVAGVFAWPLERQLPVCFGFCCRESEPSAIEGASAECLQRLGFLVGEEVESSPKFAPTPSYHQEFYLAQDKQPILQKWLAGGHEGRARGTIPTPTNRIHMTFASLDGGELYVTKALLPDALPLVFGKGHPLLNIGPLDDTVPHPIA